MRMAMLYQLKWPLISLFCVLSAPLAAATPMPAADTRLLAYNCFSCHGENGTSQGRTPSLRGLPVNYLELTLKDYKAGTRPATIMQRIAAGLSDAEIAAIAQFLVSESPAEKGE